MISGRTSAGHASAWPIFAHLARVGPGARARKHLPLVEPALNMLDQGASYDDVRKRYGMPASTLRRYRATLRANAV